MRFNSYIDQERNHIVQGHVFSGTQNTINENQFVLSSLSSCDARVSSCYGCDHPLKIIMADGSTRMPDPLFDLVLITKMCHEYRKVGEFRKSSEFRNVHFHAQMAGAVRFACVRKNVNLKKKIYTNRLQNVANFECTACWVHSIYLEIGSPSFNSIKKVYSIMKHCGENTISDDTTED